MAYIQIDEKTWLVPVPRSATTGRYITQAEITEKLLERLEGYYREDD